MGKNEKFIISKFTKQFDITTKTISI